MLNVKNVYCKTPRLSSESSFNDFSQNGFPPVLAESFHSVLATILNFCVKHVFCGNGARPPEYQKSHQPISPEMVFLLLLTDILKFCLNTKAFISQIVIEPFRKILDAQGIHSHLAICLKIAFLTYLRPS